MKSKPQTQGNSYHFQYSPLYSATYYIQAKTFENRKMTVFKKTFFKTKQKNDSICKKTFFKTNTILFISV